MKNINKLKLIQFIMGVLIAICCFILAFLHFSEKEIVWGVIYSALTCGWGWISYLDFKNIKS